MRILRAAVACAVVVAVGVVLVSGGSEGDPATPPALPGLPPPFLGTTVTGDGGLTAAVDAYGDVVDLRPGPAGPALIDNPSDRQAAGTVPEDTGIVPRVGGAPMWKADSVAQHYLPRANVVRTIARFGSRRVVMTTAAAGRFLAMAIQTTPGKAPLSLSIDVASEVHCARENGPGRLDLICEPGRATRPVVLSAPDGVAQESARVVRSAAAEARRWLGRSRPLGPAAPTWARSLYQRSLLTVHALTSRTTRAAVPR